MWFVLKGADIRAGGAQDWDVARSVFTFRANLKVHTNDNNVYIVMSSIDRTLPAGNLQALGKHFTQC